MSASMTVVACGAVCLLSTMCPAMAWRIGESANNLVICGGRVTWDQGLGNGKSRIGAGKRLMWHGRGRVGQHILLGNAAARTGAADLGQIDVQLLCEPRDHRRDEPQRRRVHRDSAA